jgi:ABC-2 type transport system ATP-binding protein
VESWQPGGDHEYRLTVSDLQAAAPEVTRALVNAGADVLAIAPSHHSLEDVYLELVDSGSEGS